MNLDASPATQWEGHEISYWRARWNIPELHIFNRIGSTNDVARQLANSGAAEGTIVLAEVQSAGRGRFGRRWHAPAGTALLLSCLARPRPAADPAPGALPLRVGLAAAAAIEAVAPLHVSLKWPNDLLLNAGKVGGILCEAASAGDALSIIVGIGINVHQKPEDWPEELRSHARSLDTAAGAVTDRARLADELIQRLRSLVDTPLDPLTVAEIAAFARRDALAGRSIAVIPGDRFAADAASAIVHGTGFGIAPDGALLLRTRQRTERITTGTVRFSDDHYSAGVSP